ncbi:S66 family peptidase [Enterococcus lemanii]|uniref:S66 peptidase family protein n=1 Tax=Enterococcus lemanii TaxID=1159752 RepID=A0ABV9MTY5_9ENTE|nr:S66 peptidase family protein [Enterococcus lemanii]MBM7709131.1 muramoyltetrapeptide carboxypeptidase LdcA involved in peptidoglycan recycling [Enterococcus lemanii]
MIKPKVWQKGDKIAIVSLSSGLLGEAFCQHNVEIGAKRLKEMGLIPVFMPHSLKGMAFVKNHPEKRATDLKAAFLDPTIKGILCAVGGEDAFLTIPYLLEDPEFIAAVKNSPKIFSGFSDTTVNHLLFYQLGLMTYYGPTFLTDLADIGPEMLPYTKKNFQRFLGIEPEQAIRASACWYEERQDFSIAAIGEKRIAHEEHNGFQWLQGEGAIEGELLGGCLESLVDLLISARFPEEKVIAEKYQLFPPDTQWQGKVIFLETSEEKPHPSAFKKMLRKLKESGIFKRANGVLFGKPQDEVFAKEYDQILVEVIANPALPIVSNINFGHAYPRTILPYGAKIEIKENGTAIHFKEEIFDYLKSTD